MCIAPAVAPDPWDSMTIFYSPTPTLSSHGSSECKKRHKSQSCLEGSMEHIRSGFMVRDKRVCSTGERNELTP